MSAANGNIPTGDNNGNNANSLTNDNDDDIHQGQYNSLAIVYSL